MLSLQFVGGGLRMADVPVPEPGEGEALVRVLLAGVCATDIEITRGYMGFCGVLGHEFVGEVAGPPGHPLSGKRVVGEINCGCGVCPACLTGLERHCPGRTVLGILGRDGAFAEYLTLPTRNLHEVPDEVDDEAAVFCEPIAACYEVLEQRPDVAEARVLILGDGRLGLLQAQVLAAAGAAVTVLGRHERKLALLAGTGVRTTTDPHAVSPPNGEKWHVVVEATGSPGGFALALSLAAPRGMVVLKSTVAAHARVSLAPAVIDEISVIGSRCGPFGPALDALARGCVRTAPLVDARFPLSEGVRALERAEAPGTLKVLIAP